MTLLMERKKTNHLDKLVLFLIIILGMYLRYVNLLHNPGVYSDEGTILDIARNLSLGKIQYLAIKDSLLLSARQPLVPLIVAGLIRLGIPALLALRLLTATMGVLTIPLMYSFVSTANKYRNGPFPYLAAFIYAVYPQAILYSRIGFSYNLLQPLVLLSIIQLMKYHELRNTRLVISIGFLIGFSLLVEIMALSYLILFFFAFAILNKKDSILFSVIASIPLGCYTVWMLYYNPSGWIFDIQFLFDRLSAIPFFAQIPAFGFNLYRLIGNNLWFGIGIVGLFLLRSFRLRTVCLLFFFLPIMILSRTVILYMPLTNYYLIPFIPLITLGVSAVVVEGINSINSFMIQLSKSILARTIPDSLRSRNKQFEKVPVVAGYSAVILLIVLPIVMMILLLTYQVNKNLENRIEFLLLDYEDLKSAANFINKNIQQSDVTIASPGFAWMVDGNVSDFQQTLAYEGFPTPHYSVNIPTNRFAFNSGFNNARFVVLDSIWWNWAAGQMPDVQLMMDTVQGWDLVYRSGEVFVYQNPGSKEK